MSEILKNSLNLVVVSTVRSDIYPVPGLSVDPTENVAEYTDIGPRCSRGMGELSLSHTHKAAYDKQLET